MFHFHCHCLSETWLTPLRSINIPHFRIFRSDRPDWYGGSAVVVHNSLKTKLIPIDPVIKTNLINPKIEVLGDEILSSDSQPTLGLWSCYIPSSSNIPTQLFQNICSSKNSLLCEDFNSFHPACGSNSMCRCGNLLYNTFNSFGLCLLNTHVRRHNSADSALDLSICSSDIFWNLSRCTLSELHGSDHIPTIIATNSSLTAKDLSSNQNPSTDPFCPNYYDFNKTNGPSFTLHIQNAILSSLEVLTPTISYSLLTNI